MKLKTIQRSGVVDSIKNILNQNTCIMQCQTIKVSIIFSTSSLYISESTIPDLPHKSVISLSIAAFRSNVVCAITSITSVLLGGGHNPQHINIWKKYVRKHNICNISLISNQYQNNPYSLKKAIFNENICDNFLTNLNQNNIVHHSQYHNTKQCNHFHEFTIISIYQNVL